METTVEPQAQRRLTLVAWFGVIWGVVLIARLIQLHVLEHDQLRLVAKSQQEHTVEVAAARGTILSGGESGTIVEVDGVTTDLRNVTLDRGAGLDVDHNSGGGGVYCEGEGAVYADTVVFSNSGLTLRYFSIRGPCTGSGTT